MNGHNIEELARQKRNAYVRAWRNKNKDKVSEANRRYWLKKAERELAEQEAAEKEVQHGA